VVREGFVRGLRSVLTAGPKSKCREQWEMANYAIRRENLKSGCRLWRDKGGGRGRGIRQMSTCSRKKQGRKGGDLLQITKVAKQKRETGVHRPAEKGRRKPHLKESAKGRWGRWPYPACCALGPTAPGDKCKRRTVVHMALKNENKVLRVGIWSSWNFFEQNKGSKSTRNLGR